MAELEKIEQIGKVNLDLTKYPGEDFYCDGAVEDELLEIVQKYSKVEYPRIIEERADWPTLYHLSSLRENIVDWIPMDENTKVLEVGSGCGAITGALSRKAGEVTCVELSKKRSMINAYRNSECDNVTIHVGNFKDVEPELPRDYDYICLIGVFEYGQSYIGGDTAYEDFLRILMGHLAPEGRIVIAIENKYGMKYFAGCREDHLGSYFSGIENYQGGSGVRTFSRRGLEKIFAACQVDKYSFYYPYPDYKFMTTLYSDAYLPGKGELSKNLCNYDRDRMVLFDEKNAFDGAIEEGVFSVFANSYIAVIGDRLDVKYVKYSNDRAPEYQIRTEICRDVNGRIDVKKHPLSKAAEEHVRGMAVAYENLRQRYDGGGLFVNKCELHERKDKVWASFEFVSGVPLSEMMDKCLEKNDLDGFHELFRQYVEKIGYNPEFPVADFDMVFSNILVKGDKWTVIDYEWTFGKEVSTKELAFRAIYCYLLEDEKRNKLNVDLILDELNITEADAQGFREQEMDFQKFVTGKRLSLAEMRGRIGHQILNPMKWVEKCQATDSVYKVQVYEDCGNGYSEENSYFIPQAFQGENEIDTEIAVSGNVAMLRIDPAMDSCIVKIKELLWNGVPMPVQSRKLIITNGKTAGGGTYIFPTTDPNINIRVAELPDRQAENILCVKMDVNFVSIGMAQDLADSVKKLI